MKGKLWTKIIKASGANFLCFHKIIKGYVTSFLINCYKGKNEKITILFLKETFYQLISTKLTLTKIVDRLGQNTFQIVFHIHK